MKKIIFSIIALSIFLTNLTAQDYSQPTRIFKKNQSDIQFSIGIIPVDMLIDNANPKIMPFNIEANRMLGENFSLGVSYGLSVMEGQTKTLVNEREQQLKKELHQISLKPLFHITRFKNADYYGGFALSVNHYNMTALKGDMEFMKYHLGTQPKSTRVAYSGVVGARFAVKTKWTIFSEINFGGASFLNLGIGYRLQ